MRRSRETRLPRARFRRARHLVGYWQDGSFILNNYATGRAVACDPITCDLLHALDEWTTEEELRGVFSELAPATVGSFLTKSAHLGLIETRKNRAETERFSRQWEPWNPAAGFFHTATRSFPASSRPTSDIEQSPTAEGRAGARQFKTYPDAAVIELPAPNLRNAFSRLLLKRRTGRRFADAPLSAARLSTLLHLVFGVQEWFDVPGRGRLALKTSPSAGACNPLEAYVLVRTVSGLEPGAYHYCCTRHRLECLTDRQALTGLPSLFPGQPWFDRAPAVIFMTAVFARKQARYRSARAYRSIFLEAGHFCQTLCLTAVSLNLAVVNTALFDIAAVERLLSLDGIREAALYSAGVGSAPAGCEWAPYPDDRPLPQRHIRPLARS